MPDHELADRIEAALGHRPSALRPLAGGCIGDVRRAEMPDGAAVVIKLDPAPTPGAGLDVEGRMLAYLRDHSALPVPAPLHAEPGLLIMELIDTDAPLAPGVPSDPEVHAADLLASLHDITPPDGRFGLGFNTLIGGLHQPNPPSDRWIPFFARHRLAFMTDEAARAGRLPAGIAAGVERLGGRLDGLLDEPARPSLIHGDVWSGNVLRAAGGGIAGFIDPAIYHAHAEIELAFITLFGTFGDRFFDRYAERRPIAPGFFEVRRDLYNLYPLLVHVRLFGGGYITQVESVLRRFQ